MATRKDQRTRIGIIGSTRYENKRKIKDLIYKLKEHFQKEFVVISGGRQTGADVYAKKYALDFNCEFKEFNPAHTPVTIYSILSENYYGKPYSPKYYFHRNSMMVKYVDYLFVFKSDLEGDNPDIDKVINEATKLNKKIVIIN